MLLLAAAACHSLVAAPMRSASCSRPALHSRRVLPAMEFVDLFPDPIVPSVGGNAVIVPETRFPALLDSPVVSSAAPATITPFPEFIDIVFAPTEANDAIAAVFVGVALLLGPDFLLAPAGLVSDEGIRPGYALERVLGDIIDPDAQWLKDRKEKLATSAPYSIKTIILTLFVAAGLLVERLLLVALEDSSFVISIGICSCIGGGLLEVIREPLPTREERDLLRRLTDEFFVFANERIEPSGRCHETDIVREFRAFYPRYRRCDMGQTTDGVSLPDDEIGDLVRKWNSQVGRPGTRTSTGYWKGISVAPKATG